MSICKKSLRGLVERLRGWAPALIRTRMPIAAEHMREAATEIEALLDRITELEEARDHYAGLYADRCGMLLQAQTERDAADQRPLADNAVDRA